MPIYHLEVDDGIRVTVDMEGAEYRDVQVARRELFCTLMQIMSDSGSGQDSRDIIGRITDASGANVYAVTLSLRCRDMRTVDPSINSN